jgi:hypothetical protein
MVLQPSSALALAAHRAHALDELVVERLLVQEHVGVVVLLVEAVLHLLHARDDPLQVTVAREDDERGTRAPAVVVDHEVIAERLSLDDAAAGADLGLDGVERGRVAICLVRDAEEEVQADLRGVRKCGMWTRRATVQLQRAR